MISLPEGSQLPTCTCWARDAADEVRMCWPGPAVLTARCPQLGGIHGVPQLLLGCLEKGPPVPAVLRVMLASEARGCHFVQGFQLHEAELSQQCQHMPPLGLFRMSFVGSFSSGSEFIHADHFHPFDIA